MKKWVLINALAFTLSANAGTVKFVNNTLEYITINYQACSNASTCNTAMRVDIFPGFTEVIEDMNDNYISAISGHNFADSLKGKWSDGAQLGSCVVKPYNVSDGYPNNTAIFENHSGNLICIIGAGAVPKHSAKT